MGKDRGRGNERLDAEALAVHHVTEGEGWVEKFLWTFRLANFEMPRI